MLEIVVEINNQIHVAVVSLLSLLNIIVVNCGSKKIAVCSNYVTYQCYSTTIAAIWQQFVLNSLMQNNSNLFKFHYNIVV